MKQIRHLKWRATDENSLKSQESSLLQTNISKGFKKVVVAKYFLLRGACLDSLTPTFCTLRKNYTTKLDMSKHFTMENVVIVSALCEVA